MKDLKKALIKYHKLLSLVLVALSILVAWRIILPKYQQLRNLYLANQNELARVERLEAKIRDLESINEFELKEKSEILLKAVPSEKNPIGTMSVISQLVEESGIFVRSLKISPGEVATGSGKTSQIEELSFALDLEGEIDKFINFLKATGEVLPLAEILLAEIDISGATFSTDCTFKTFYSGLPTSLGKIDAEVPKLSSEEELLVDRLLQFRKFEAEIFKPAPAGRPNPFTF